MIHYNSLSYNLPHYIQSPADVGYITEGPQKPLPRPTGYLDIRS